MNGFIYPIVNFLIKILKNLNLIEYLKLLFSEKNKSKKDRKKNANIYLFLLSYLECRE